MRMLAAAAAAALAVTAAPASAATILDTGAPPATLGGGGFYDTTWYGVWINVPTLMTVTTIKGFLGTNGNFSPDEVAPDPTSRFTIHLRGGSGLTGPAEYLYSYQVDIGAGEYHDPDWYGTSGLTWTVQPGGYWVTFEVNEGDDFSGYMPGGAPLSPVRSASYIKHNGAWIVSPGGKIGVKVEGVPFASAVPEPATWAMMITGFGLAGAALRRRTRSTAAA